MRTLEEIRDALVCLGEGEDYGLWRDVHDELEAARKEIERLKGQITLLAAQLDVASNSKGTVFETWVSGTSKPRGES